jgi:hypothetical protein
MRYFPKYILVALWRCLCPHPICRMVECPANLAHAAADPCPLKRSIAAIVDIIMHRHKEADQLNFPPTHPGGVMCPKQVSIAIKHGRNHQLHPLRQLHQRQYRREGHTSSLFRRRKCFVCHRTHPAPITSIPMEMPVGRNLLVSRCLQLVHNPLALHCR